MENLQTRRILDFGQTLRDAFVNGWHHALPIAGCYLLWVATVWIPYINIGTTIAIMLLPVELANGRRIAPLSIFSTRYRRDMGQYLMAIGLQLLPAIALFFIMIYICYSVSLVYNNIDSQWIMDLMTDPAAFFARKTVTLVVILIVLLFLFCISIPMSVLLIGWSMTFYYIGDRQLSPLDALTASSRATYGSKWMIVLASLLLGLAMICGLYALMGLTAMIHNTAIALMVLLVLFVAFSSSFTTAFNASVWQQLKDNDK